MSGRFWQSWRKPLMALATGSGVIVAMVTPRLAKAEEMKPSSPKKTPMHAFSLCKPEQPADWDFNWDFREPDDSDAEIPRASRHIILIRHGLYNHSDIDEGRTLSNKGREQIEHTGKRLVELGFPIDKIVYSTMTRATESGKIISKYFPEVPVETCSLIREGAPIPPIPDGSLWRQPASNYFADGARIEAGFRKHFYRAPVEQTKTSHEVLVCHGNVIRYYVCRALQMPPEAWLRLNIFNGSITWITIRPNGRVTLKMYSDSGFLPKNLISTN